MDPIDQLFDLLYRRKKKDYLRIFMDMSSQNQYETFKLATSDDYEVRRIGDYILVFSNKLGLFVVGLDENDRFFCHCLPQRLNYDEIHCLSERDIRDLMGFDVHFWEHKVSENLRIRLQGDIVINVLKMFSDLEGIEKYIMLLLDHSILASTFYFANKKTYGNFVDSLRQMKLVFLDRDILYRFSKKMIIDALNDFAENNIVARIIPLLDLITMAYMLGVQIPEIINAGQEEIESLLYDIRRKIDHIVSNLDMHEHIYRATIGRHKIKLIGTHFSYNINISRFYTNSEYPESSLNLRLGGPSTFLLLRPQYIVSMHPEHGTISRYFPRSIIRISTLRYGRYQIRHGENTRQIREIKVKIPKHFVDFLAKLLNTDLYRTENPHIRNALIELLLSIPGKEELFINTIDIVRILNKISIETSISPIEAVEIEQETKELSINTDKISLKILLGRKINEHERRIISRLKILQATW